MTIGVTGQDIAGAEGRFGRVLPRALDLTERTLVVLTFMFYLGANVASLNPLNIVLALTDSITVFCILLRRPADSVSLSPFDWALAIIGTVGAMFARPGGQPLAGEVLPSTLWLAGLFISLVAKLSLNLRFGVAPANRGVQTHGAYAFVRHPMYAGYMLMGTAYLLVNPTTFNMVIYAIAWTCQFGRVHREEAWLRQDPAYRDYAKAVRYRFFPFLV